MAKNGATKVVDTESTEETKVEISPESRRKLFDEYAKKDKLVKDAEAALNAAMDVRSTAVIAIIEKCGNGPFRFNGQVLTATKRKKLDGKTVAFFRGPMVNENIPTI